MPAYGEIVAAYETEYPLYQRLAAYAEHALREALKAAGVYTMPVTARAKDPQSFGIKACIGRRYEHPLEQIKDKAGVRVTVVYDRDVDSVVAIIKRTFTCLNVDRKLDALDFNENGYLGTHLEVRLTPEQAKEGGADLAERSFEIQVRTMAQSAWAEVAHAQLYKPAAEVADGLKRRIYRLVALVELFDSEVEAFRVEAEHTAGYREAALVAPFVEQLARLGSSRAPSRGLTLELSAAVVPLYVDVPAQELNTLLQTFIADNEAGLRNVLREAEAAPARDMNPLLAQPELPMLCERLERDRVRLEQAWPGAVPLAWLNDLAEKWGLGHGPG